MQQDGDPGEEGDHDDRTGHQQPVARDTDADRGDRAIGPREDVEVREELDGDDRRQGDDDQDESQQPQMLGMELSLDGSPSRHDLVVHLRLLVRSQATGGGAFAEGPPPTCGEAARRHP